MACPTSPYEVYFFIRGTPNPSGIGSLEDPFKIANGTLGDQQKQVIQDGIDAIYASMGLSNQLYNEITYPETLLTATPNQIALGDVYQAIADVYGEVYCNLTEANTDLYSALEKIIVQPNPEVEIDLFEVFRDSYYNISNRTFDKIIPAIIVLSNRAMSRTKTSSINDFIQAYGIYVTQSWADFSGIAGYPIDPQYIL